MNAVVNIPVCPLMSCPAFRCELADEALYGMAVEILERPAPGWCKVLTHYGYEGYVPQRCLLFHEEKVSAWAALPKKVVFHKNSCDVLAQPKVQSWPLLSLTRGALLHPVGEELDGWQKVRLCDGREGYTRSSFLGEYYKNRPYMGEDAFRRLLTDTALLYLGTHYRWGGKTPLGIDCSGLVFMAYLLSGVIIWRDAQIKAGYPVHEIDLQRIGRGDLLFFPGHVAMYLEAGRYIHSTGAPDSDGVAIGSLRPGAQGYRADLAASLYSVGSIFP